MDLHSLYRNGSIQKARSIILGGSVNSKLSRSPSHQHQLIGAHASEINRKDFYGRTVMHLIVMNQDSMMTEWLELLLGPGTGVLVNIVDDESGWTCLHKAMYCGNLIAARMLLMRSDIDAGIKDHEGLTAMDVYNASIDGTNPKHTDVQTDARSQLFSWGSNKNLGLGFEDGRDRAFPEQVVLNRTRELNGQGQILGGAQVFEPVRIREVHMARLHSAVITDEPNNLRMCGYGTAGRLGSNTDTQFTFSPVNDLPTLPTQVATCALSPDHTMLIMTNGEVWTFGLNRFSQLGYMIDSTSNTKSQEPIQSLPKRVVGGGLKKEFVIGGCASRAHSLAYTSDSVYTWGTNRGQLGYNLGGAAGTVQIVPRKVTSLPEIPVIASTATESSSALLLESKEVLVLYKEAFVKINFSLARFPSKMQTYRSPQVSSRSEIIQISSCGTTFAALSSHGDVFTFALDNSNSTTTDYSLSTSSAGPSEHSSPFRNSPRTQRIWSLRRKFTAVTSIAVGMQGTVVISTVAGHVYLGQQKENTKSGTSTPTSTNAWKFTKIPTLQRVIAVKASSNNSFAAIRLDVPVKEIIISGADLAVSYLKILPHYSRILSIPLPKLPAKINGKGKGKERIDEYDVDDEELEVSIEEDILKAGNLIRIIELWKTNDFETPKDGSDIVLEVAGGIKIPLHRVILQARSNYLRKKTSNCEEKVLLPDCSFLAGLLLSHYLYSDDLPAVWDARIGMRLRESFKTKIDFSKIKLELVGLAELLELPALSRSLVFQTKTVPAPRLTSSFSSPLSNYAVAGASESPSADVVLVLQDNIEILVHSTILRARVLFFATLFSDQEWIQQRLVNGRYRFNFDFSLRTISILLEFVYRDVGVTLFDDSKLPSDSSDEFLDFMFEIVSASNFFMLDKLKLICSSVIRSFITPQTVTSILGEAAFYECSSLVAVATSYIQSSMETMLQQHLLDDLPLDLLGSIQESVQNSISSKFPITRSGPNGLSGFLYGELLEKHSNWLSDHDFGRSTGGARKFKSLNGIGKSPVISPLLSPVIRARATQLPSPLLSPTLEPLREEESLFQMDDFQLDVPPQASPPVARWNQPILSAPTDLRSIMAAAESQQKLSSKPRASIESLSSSPVPRRSSVPLTWRSTGAEPTSVSLARIQSEQSSRPKPVPAFSPSSSSPRPLTSTSAIAMSPSPTPVHNIITPVRLAARSGQSTPTKRHNSSFGGADVPWTNYVPPVAPISNLSSPNSSFLSIQSAQTQQKNQVSAGKAPRSLISIQQEEAAVVAKEAADLNEEIEFAKWWNAESARVLAESNQTAGNQVPGSNKRGGKKKARGKGENVRGRGGGGNRGKSVVASAT